LIVNYCKYGVVGEKQVENLIMYFQVTVFVSCFMCCETCSVTSSRSWTSSSFV